MPVKVGLLSEFIMAVITFKWPRLRVGQKMVLQIAFSIAPLVADLAKQYLVHAPSRRVKSHYFSHL
jgi:hypothetical protein